MNAPLNEKVHRDRGSSRCGRRRCSPAPRHRDPSARRSSMPMMAGVFGDGRLRLAPGTRCRMRSRRLSAERPSWSRARWPDSCTPASATSSSALARGPQSSHRRDHRRRTPAGDHHERDRYRTNGMIARSHGFMWPSRQSLGRRDPPHNREQLGDATAAGTNRGPLDFSPNRRGSAFVSSTCWKSSPCCSCSLHRRYAPASGVQRTREAGDDAGSRPAADPIVRDGDAGGRLDRAAGHRPCGRGGLGLGMLWVEVQFPALLGWVLDLYVPLGLALAGAGLALALSLAGALLPSAHAA